MSIRRMRNKGWVGFWLFLLLAGCAAGEKEAAPKALLTCGARTVTVADYRDALKVALQGYPYGCLARKADVKAIRQGVFHQLQEELLLLCVADETGVTLDDEDLDKAVQGARDGYPEGAFEKELASRGLSLETWERRLAKRLLVEKVLKAEFGKGIELTYDDFQALRDGMNTEVSEEGLIHQAKQARMETAYRSWRRSPGGKYSIEVNGKLWEKILEEDRP